MTQPLVTVVIPVYNVEQYLDRCVKSVVNQTYKNLEIILVDDGANDSCPQLCDNWAEKDSRIKVIHKKNAGLGMARNSGLEKATGEYVFFFDSDDYVDLEIVEKCVANATEYNSDVVMFGRYDVYENGECKKSELNIKKHLFKGSEICEELLPGLFNYEMGIGVSAWSKMFRLSCFKDNDVCFMSEREIISEDAYFAVEFFSKLNVVTVLDENFYYYFKRGNSLSHTYKADRQKLNDIFIKKVHTLAENLEIKNVIPYLNVRYQMYTIATLKQVMASTLPEKEKNREINKILHSEVLKSTLDNSTIQLHKKSLKLFFTLLKYRLFMGCKILLKYKNNSKGE